MGFSCLWGAVVLAGDGMFSGGSDVLDDPPAAAGCGEGCCAGVDAGPGTGVGVGTSGAAGATVVCGCSLLSSLFSPPLWPAQPSRIVEAKVVAPPEMAPAAIAVVLLAKATVLCSDSEKRLAVLREVTISRITLRLKKTPR